MSVISRFLRYVTYHTTSDDGSQAVPSTPGQLELARLLVQELQELGLSDAMMDQFGRVYAHLPATQGYEDKPVLGLIAHMDTAPDVSGQNVKPSLVEYTGGDILLNEELGIRMGREEFPCLERYEGKTLIVTDGTTLLGADNKAGVAEIMATVEWLVNHPEVPHVALAVAFTCDEEIGRGADHFDYERFGATYAYTIDGGTLGEVEYENFNAAEARLSIQGRNIHPGSAKNIMKNAILMATQFVSMLPEAESPAHTEGYEGFFHVHHFQANEEHAEVRVIIRDHDRAKFESRKAFLRQTVEYLNQVHGEDRFTLSIQDSYYNMKEMILPHMELIHRAEAAFAANGVQPIIRPIRGGTDGARLSWEGLPCPNLSTGAENFHGIHEFACVEDMEQMVRMLVHLVEWRD